MKRDLRAIKNWLFFVDFGVLLAIGMILGPLLLGYAKVGYKAYISSISCLIAGTMLFMWLMDEYTLSVYSFKEQKIIFFLSIIYSWILVFIANAFIIASFRVLVVSACFALAFFIGLTVENRIAHLIFDNEKWFQKQNLLILCTREKDQLRANKIKNGATGLYNSIEEFFDSNKEEEIERVINEEIPKYDVICLLDGIRHHKYSEMVRAVVKNDKELYVVPRLLDVGRAFAETVKFDDIVALHVPQYSISKANAAVKRIFDIFAATIGLLLASVPMLLITVLIKMTSKGPAFYKQTRLTKDKKEFKIYKFRTMINNAENLTGPIVAQKDDPRITKVGGFLRQCRLDELPQLINVLRGEMSMVGPRPERPVFVEEYSRKIQNYDYRFKVKAGLTSLSHVYGKYSTYIKDRTTYDLIYLSSYSFMLDLKILLLTSKIVLMKSAAEGIDDDLKEADQSAKNPEERGAEKNERVV